MSKANNNTPRTNTKKRKTTGRNSTPPPNQNIPQPNTTIKKVYTDAQGNVLDSFDWNEKTELKQGGEINTEKISVSKVLADGSCYDPTMSRGPKPVNVGVCHFCMLRKDRNKSPLVNLDRSVTCPDCGHIGCKNCMRQCSDGKYRNKSCRIKYNLKRLVTSIFTCPVDEDY